MNRVKVRMLMALLSALVVCSGAAQASEPAPTPVPRPVMFGGVPAYMENGRGLPAETWIASFLSNLSAYGIPVSATEFEHLSHNLENGYTSCMYRLEAGGAEVFLQVIDEETVIHVIVYLDGERMETPALAEAMARYYPSILRACIAACEVDAKGGEATKILAALHLDVEAMVRSWQMTDITIRPIRTVYHLTCSQRAKTASFSCRWSR